MSVLSCQPKGKNLFSDLWTTSLETRDWLYDTHTTHQAVAFLRFPNTTNQTLDWHECHCQTHCNWLVRWFTSHRTQMTSWYIIELQTDPPLYVTEKRLNLTEISLDCHTSLVTPLPLKAWRHLCATSDIFLLFFKCKTGKMSEKRKAYHVWNYNISDQKLTVCINKG